MKIFWNELVILKHLLTDETKHEFVMEVTDKTRADVKVNEYFLIKIDDDLDFWIGWYFNWISK